MANSIGPAVPVGTVLLYAGDATSQALKNKLSILGWVNTDGSPWDVDTNADLYQAIGSCHGGATDPLNQGEVVKFNLPNLGGEYVRGVTGTSSNDPDAATRKILAFQMSVPNGNFVGTVQSRATGRPVTPFTTDAAGDHAHVLSPITDSTDGVTGWTGSDAAQQHGIWPPLNAAGNHTHSVTGGGDAETAPVSCALYHLIKFDSPAYVAPSPQVPIGGIVMYAGDLSDGTRSADLAADGWLACTGDVTAVGTYPQLFAVIKNSFGGDGTTSYYLPDMRGRFVRGADRGGGSDPDRNTRPVSRPDLSPPSGQAGPHVGSSQPFATRLPMTPFTMDSPGDHTHFAPKLPQGTFGISLGIHNHYVVDSNSDNATSTTDGAHSHTIAGGGDSETRPDNVYLHWLVRYADTGSEVPLPPGTIMAFAGDSTDPQVKKSLADRGWALCDGSTLVRNDYLDLSAVILDLYQDPKAPLPAEKFALPNLGGLFVRGADPTHPCGIVTTPSTTQRPTNAFVTDNPGDHTHKVQFLPDDDNTAETGGDPAAETAGAGANSQAAGNHTHNVTGGGDAETRPINLYLDFVIKLALDKPQGE